MQSASVPLADREGPEPGSSVMVSSGASDNYVVVNNNLIGNIEGGLSDGGTGKNKIVSPNLM